MADELTLEIVTPERVTFRGVVEEVTIPGTEGEFGVLKGHAPLLASVDYGELSFLQDHAKTRYAVHSGYAEVSASKVTVLVARARNVRVHQHPENRGSGAGRKTGLLLARGNIIVMIDADGTYPAEAIPQLLEYFPMYDQVVGARQTEEGTHRFLRTVAKESVKALASYLVGKPIPDLNSGLRAFKKDLMLRYMYLIPDGFSCVSTMSLSFLANKHPVAYMPIAYFARIGRSKFHPIKDTYNYILTVIRVATYFHPLHVFIPLSLVLMGFGVAKSVLDFLLTSTIQESDIIAILAGVIVAAIGILADLIITQGKKDHGANR